MESSSNAGKYESGDADNSQPETTSVPQQGLLLDNVQWERPVTVSEHVRVHYATAPSLRGSTEPKQEAKACSTMQARRFKQSEGMIILAFNGNFCGEKNGAALLTAMTWCFLEVSNCTPVGKWVH